MQKIIVFVVGISLCAVVNMIDAKQMKKPTGTTSAMPVRTMPLGSEVINPVVTQTIDKKAVVKELDEHLASSIDSAWNEQVDDLLFDLAGVDREMARVYSQKIRDKRGAAVNRPSEMVVEKIAKKSGVESREITPEGSVLADGEEPMKKSTRSAPPKKGAPSGGPAKKLGAPKSPSDRVVEKPVAPKVVEQVFSLAHLNKLDDEKLLMLFNDLLDKLSLPVNWNGQIVEKIEEKTKYGSKIYNLYGAPVTKWLNDINTLKKVLSTKNIIPEKDLTARIADRIIQVRAEKMVKPVASGSPEEKPKEELTEDDLVKLMKMLFADPRTDQIGWVVSIKGNIKALDKLNHDKAMQYHDQFIKLTGEKPFLK